MIMMRALIFFLAILLNGKLFAQNTVDSFLVKPYLQARLK